MDSDKLKQVARTSYLYLLKIPQATYMYPNQ